MLFHVDSASLYVYQWPTYCGCQPFWTRSKRNPQIGGESTSAQICPTPPDPDPDLEPGLSNDPWIKCPLEVWRFKSHACPFLFS